MNQREKILAIVTALALGLALVVVVAMKLVIDPTAAAKMQAVDMEGKVEKLQRQVNWEREYRASLRDWIAASFGDEPSTATELSRAHLVRTIGRAGLSGEDVGLTPISGRSIRGGREIGWIVRVKGSQEKMTSLLYLLSADPHLNKVDTVNWSPIANATDLSLTFRYTTLVFDPIEGEQPLPIRPDELKIADDVEKDKDRLAFNLIAQRDIFRPYIKKPPAPPPPPPTRTVRTDDPPREAAPPASTPSLQLVGLPTWNNDVEVVVRDTRSLKSKTYKIGEDLLGGEIVMVDYRALPLLKKPEVFSSSRVIVLIGRDYWAVELGHYLTDKYLVPRDRLPRELASPALSPAPVNVPSPASNGAASSDATSKKPVPVPPATTSPEAGAPAVSPEPTQSPALDKSSEKSSDSPATSRETVPVGRG